MGPALSVRLREVSVLERCPSYRESNKGSKERQGPTLSVCFTEVSVKRELTIINSVKVCHPSQGAVVSHIIPKCHAGRKQRTGTTNKGNCHFK